MKTRYYILAGILYTIFIGFTASTIQHRITQEELKSVYEEEYCEVVYEYTGEVYGDEWNELFAIAVENEEERDELVTHLALLHSLQQSQRVRSIHRRILRLCIHIQPHNLSLIHI